MLLDMRSPIQRRPFWCIAQLHVTASWSFPKRNDFPFLRLTWKPKRFAEMAHRSSEGGAFELKEILGRVYFVCVSFLKERDCSLRLFSGRARAIRTKRIRARGHRRAAEHEAALVTPALPH
jgi:hypothetical protein